MSQWRFTSSCILLLLMSSCLFFACKEPEQIIQTDLEEFEVEHHILIRQTMANEIEEMPEVFNRLNRVTYQDAYIYVNRLVSQLKLKRISTSLTRILRLLTQMASLRNEKQASSCVGISFM